MTTLGETHNIGTTSMGIQTPEITALQLKIHFTEHQLVLSHNLASDANDIRRMQQKLLSKELSSADIKLYMQLSTKKMALISRLDKIQSRTAKLKPYSFE